MLIAPRSHALDGDAYGLAPSVVVYAVDDGSARLIDLDGAFYALSPSAAELLQETLDHGVASAATRVAVRYDVSPTQVRADLNVMLADLARRGLIETAQRFSRWRCLRRALAVVVMVPLLQLTRHLISVERSDMVAMILLARLSIALFGCGASIAAWGRAIPKGGAADPPSPDVLTRLDQAVRTSAMKLPSVGCKERALACWYAARLLNAQASLIIGLQLYPLGGHCWCLVGDRVLSDGAQRCADYVPIIRSETGSDLVVLEKESA